MNNIYTNAARNIATAFVFLFSLSLLTVAAIAAPPNDNFANAQVITGVNNFVNGTNIGSTVEAGEPIHALNRGGGSVWYKYTAPGNGVLRINTGGSDFNTILSVYAGSTLANLKFIAANNNYDENGTWGQYSNVRVGASTGDVFYIVVDGNNNNDANGVAAGNIKLNYFFENVASNDNFANAISLGSSGKQVTTTTNVGASKEVGEPNHAGNAGGKSVWYRWTAPQGIAKTYAFTVSNYAVDQVSSNHQALFAIYTGSSVASLTPVANGAAYYYSKIVFKPVPGTTYYIALDGFDSGAGSMTGTFTLSYGINTSDKVPDIDGDGKADLSVYRPTTGVFYSYESTTDRLRGYQWGTNGDKPLIVDKDRDGKMDYTVFRPDSGVWYTDRSSNPSNEIYNWGIDTDIPMFRRRASTTGLNDALATVFRQSTGTWYSYTGGNPIVTNFGLNGDIPVLADFTGDGTDDLTVFRPSTGKWYIMTDPNNAQFTETQFGINGDKPVVADYDGDGRADIAVYRPSNGTWYVLRSSDGAVQIAQFGLASDKPQPADYDGDSKADYAVYRNGIWWIYQSSTGTAKAAAFGLSTDIPITAPAN